MSRGYRRAVLLGYKLNKRKASKEPLWPFDGGSGQSLFMMSGMKTTDYFDAFERMNAEDIEDDRPLLGRYVVVLGKAAWSKMGLPPTGWWGSLVARGITWVLIPHPSGRNRVYNDEQNRHRAGVVLRMVAACQRSAEHR